MVGRQPIGHYQHPYSAESTKSEYDSAKVRPSFVIIVIFAEPHQVYFFKGHILAGQCAPDGEEIVDFAWLTKQEIQQYVEPYYWEAVKDMLSDL